MGASRSSIRALLWLAGVVWVGLAACTPGFAADQTVTVGSGGALTFSPSTVSINAGESVTWNAVTSTLHNVTCNSVTPSPGAPAINCWSPSGDFVNNQAGKDPFVLPSPANANYFQKSGTYSYECTRHDGMEGTVIVNPGMLHHFEVVAPLAKMAGEQFSVSITALDQFNNKVSFSGSVSLSISNPHPSGGEIPATTSLSGGTGSFNVTAKRSGSRTITVTSGSITGSDTVAVSPAAVHHLALTAPGTVNAGVNFTATVTAQDQFNNTAIDYAGTIQITSGDSAAVLPAAAALDDGTGGFAVKLLTPGLQSVTATDTANAALTISRNVNVNAACSLTFSNPAPITINDISSALPYPSTITVAGLRQTVTDLSVTINGLTSPFGADVDVLLEAPTGQKMILMSDVPGVVVGLTIVLKDGAPQMPTPWQSGTFRPTNIASLPDDSFPAPAPPGPHLSPAPTGNATLASLINPAFEGVDPNGVWKLYVVDDEAGGAGSISGGWSLTFDPGPNTFCNSQTISIPSSGISTPYPSEVEVSGVAGTVKDFSLRLVRFGHTFPRDTDVLLVGPQGQKMIAMADAGGDVAVSSLIINLHDSGTSHLPAGTVISSGIVKPTNIDDIGAENDVFSSPAPAAPYANPGPEGAGTATFASTFGGTDPNGIWKLFVRDDLGGGTGSITGGWALSFDVVYNTTTTLTSNINPSTFGQTISLRASISSPTPATGTVTFMDGSTLLGTRTVLGGRATLTASTLNGGFHQITATYSGDATHHPSSSSLTQRVNPRSTTTALTLPLSSSSYGQSVNLSATVSSLIGTPAGSVTFQSLPAGIPGAVPTVIGVAALSGTPPTAMLAAPLPKGGSQIVVAVYSGSANHSVSTSPAVPHTVSPAATSTFLVSSSNPSLFGSPATLTANVSSTAGVPIGSVVFKDGPATVATVALDDSGIAELSTANFAVGTHAITATFNATAEFGISASAVLNQLVNKATPAVEIISFQDHSSFGDSVTFRADVSTSLSTKPTGTVTFKDGATPLMTVPLDVVSGTALFSTAALGGGSHNMTVTYNGDANFSITNSAVVTQQVDPAGTGTTLGSSPNPSNFGQSVTFTAMVTSGVGTPAGSVTFMDGATPLDLPATLSGAGVATLTTPALSAGSHSITAVYNGSANFAGSTSAPPLVQGVEQSETTILLSASKDTSVFREAVTFTVRVSSTSSGTPTGTVTFLDGTTELGGASLNAVGEASITLTNLSVGKRVITVGYRGDANFPANTSPPLIHYRSPKPRGQP